MSINNNTIIFSVFAGLVFVLLLAFTSFHIYSILGCTVFAFFFIKIFIELGYNFDIRDLIVFLAFLQWILGPVLAYAYNPNHINYYMSVSEEEYITYVFPACLLLIIGLYFPFWQKGANEKILLLKLSKRNIKRENVDILLIFVGSIATAIENYTPGSLKFFIILLGGLKFVGLYYLILFDRPHKWWIFGFVFSWVVVSSLRYQMFHDLILWFGFLLVIVSLLYPISIFRKILLSFVMFVLLFLIQSVKYHYRFFTRQQGAATLKEKSEIFLDLVKYRLTHPDTIFHPVFIDANIVRINQGWIITRIMDWVPKYEPFADGETIKAGFYALMPRVLAPDKVKAGGRQNIRRFTGKRINETTSMNISIVGEAYANYGKNGGMLFMLIYGFCLNAFLYILYSYISRYPTLILWLPLIFLHAVKAETDFATIINYIFKASIVVAAIFWGLQRFFGFDLRRK